MSLIAEVRNPRDGTVLGAVDLLPDAAVAEVAGTSVLGFSTWSSTPPAERAAHVDRLADILSGCPPTVVRQFSLETGKTLAEARTELDRTVDTFRWAARSAGDVLRPIPLADRSGVSREVVVDPAGPVLAIVPSNFPAVVTARKVGPALVMGCSVVVKAPETTPSVVRHIAAAAVEAGIPPEVVQVVFATPATSAALVGRPEFRVVSFTGSTRAGRLVAAAAVPGLAQCVLELGGHAPAIVLADADLDAAVGALVGAKFASAGQSCAAPSRFLVARERLDAFVERFVAAAPLMDHQLDPQGRPGTMGPLHTAGRAEQVHELVLDAVARGARVRSGGHLPGTAGFYYPATVLTEVPPLARVLTEEPFGPLAPVVGFDDEDQAVAMADSSSYRLGAFVFGGTRRAVELARRLDVGRVSVNCATGADPESPLSGRGDSGFGYEGGDQGLLAFARLKAVHQPNTHPAGSGTPRRGADADGGSGGGRGAHDAGTAVAATPAQ